MIVINKHKKLFLFESYCQFLRNINLFTVIYFMITPETLWQIKFESMVKARDISLVLWLLTLEASNRKVTRTLEGEGSNGPLPSTFNKIYPIYMIYFISFFVLSIKRIHVTLTGFHGNRSYMNDLLSEKTWFIVILVIFLFFSTRICEDYQNTTKNIARVFNLDFSHYILIFNYYLNK